MTTSVGELLRAFVLADGTVSALVGTRMYPLRLPQKFGGDSLVYQRISGVRIGKLVGPASAAEPRYQIDAWAMSVKAALTLGQAVRRRLEGYTGTWTDAESPATSVTVAVRFDSENEMFQEDILGGLCRHSADYFIFHGSNGGEI